MAAKTGKLEKATEAKYHPYAECTDDDCGWQTGQSVVARDRAKSHVRGTGHDVRVITETVALWGLR